MKKLYLALLILISISYSFAAQPEKGLGVNLSRVADWGPAMPFTDIFRKSRAKWIPQRSTDWTWDTGESLSITKEGWIASLATNQEAVTVINVSLQGHYPAGIYHCYYEGEGEISFGHDAKLLQVSDNHCTVDVNPTNAGILVKIKKTTPSNPLRNIKLIMPGYETSYQQNFFYPPYINSLRKYKVVRYMDWQKTNNSPVSQWSERTTPNHSSQARDQGVAYEYIIELSNLTGTSPWISIPHAADDDYIRNVAIMFRDTLRADLKVYVEYSNEVWNSVFGQRKYARAQAVSRGYTESNYWKFTSERSVEIFNIFTQAYGNNDKIVRVLGGFSENTWLNERIMEWKDAYKSSDAITIAPYFGHRITSTNTNTVLNEAEVDMRKKVSETFPKNLAAANKFGLSLISYEAGQHMTGKSGGISVCSDANRHDRMEGIYTEYLKGWSDATDNNLILLWNNVDRYGSFGCWGLREWHDQTAETAPKYRAVLKQLGIDSTLSPPMPPVLSPQIKITN